MPDPKRITLPSAPRHYIVVAHGMGEQKINTTIPAVVQRFAEVRHKKRENFYNIIIPASLSSQSVRSETELHGWSEFRGIPADDSQSVEDFDGTPATDTAGENLRFVELYWQDILQAHQSRFASDLEDWTKAMLERLQDPSITPREWLPSWALPLLQSIAGVAVPLKKMLAFKYVQQVNLVFNGFLGDVHLYGDYARTRGETVRHFHATLDKLMFYDFLDWRIRELTVSSIRQEPLVAGFYQKPEISIMAHSLGSIMSFDALVYAQAKACIRESGSESIEFDSSFPFFGYLEPSKEEKNRWDKHKEQLEKFILKVDRRIAETVIQEFRIDRYKDVFDMFFDAYSESGFSDEQKKREYESLDQCLGGGFPILKWHADKKVHAPTGNEYPGTVLFPGEERVVPVASGDEDQAPNGVVEKGLFDFTAQMFDQVKCDRTNLKEFVRGGVIDDAAFHYKLDLAFDLFEQSVVAEAWSHYEKVRISRASYWRSFLDGFVDVDCGQARVFEQPVPDKPPHINEAMYKSIPVLLWKNCVRNFITLGSPIDKYIALWHQNYIHLGLRVKDYTTPDRWIHEFRSEYDFSSSDGVSKIKHYNFCDEQDPVGQHLDIARKTDVYPLIFEAEDASKRDIVFRRYGFPGLAHNMYWRDGELFRGILREIIDRKESGSSTYFANDEFRKKDNARKQGFLWAYFRLPQIVSVVTALLLTYALNNLFNDKPLSGVVVLVLTLSLWAMPGILNYYERRTDIENVDRPSIMIFIEKLISPGLFCFLLMAMVEWRRILVMQSEGENVRGDDDMTHLAVQDVGDLFVWREFFVKWLWRFIAAVALLSGLSFLINVPEYAGKPLSLWGFECLERVFRNGDSMLPFTFVNESFTNIIGFIVGMSLCIYIPVSIFVCIWFFVIRNRYEGLGGGGSIAAR
jgi:hypothetical protein